MMLKMGMTMKMMSDVVVLCISRKVFDSDNGDNDCE